MDYMCMEASLSLSSPITVSSTSTSQVGLRTVSGVNSSFRVVPLASCGVCLLVGELIPPQPKGGVSVIVPDSITGLLQSSTPIVQGGKSLRVFSNLLLLRLYRCHQFQKSKGYVSIQVDPIAYQARLELCRNALIGHMVLSSGEWPWKLVDLKARLSKHWMLNFDWRLISLGKGYYQIFLKSSAKMNHVWGFSSVHLKPGSTLSAALICYSDPSSSTVSAFLEVASSSVTLLISQVLQISKGLGFDDGVTDSVLVSGSLVVDPSISSVNSAIGVVYDSRAVVQGSSVVNQVHLIVFTIFSRSSSRPSHMTRRQVRVHEVSGNQSSKETVASSALNVNMDHNSLRDGSGFSCSSDMDPMVQIQISGQWSKSQVKLRLIVNSSWASQVEEAELAGAEVAQRASRVEHRLASLKSGCRAPSTIYDD
ncbi:hypothetical protein LWI28_025575 [Acer negundo]|uniref:Uncharacterized protein n=1 Tax=Acer negundo TaxID=4023 RepID=A0AAD5J1A2_ACENE|nr:hypothetical protein LWI28_025575 [Acer negundo]